MKWIWQQKNWPHFSYKSISDLDEKFIQRRAFDRTSGNFGNLCFGGHKDRAA